ncbi:MAG TPA: hypothetical protein VFU47_02930 [Armatimonadota bacterium]|nr:hypothetical protein [Armatimonadota bacterium]
MNPKETLSNNVPDLHPQGRSMVPEPTADSSYDLSRLPSYIHTLGAPPRRGIAPRGPGYNTL